MLTSKQIYDRLITAYGQPDWWPGTPYAIMVTAILVQNTAWSNVEKAVAEMGERLWGAMVDYVTVGVDKRLTFVFRDGTEVEHKETVSLTY